MCCYRWIARRSCHVAASRCAGNHAINHHDDADARSTPNQNHPVRQNQNQVQSPPPREVNEGNGKDEGQKDPRPGREDENDNHLHSSAAVIPESRSYPTSRSPSALRNSRAVGPGHSALALPLGSLYTEDSASPQGSLRTGHQPIQSAVRYSRIWS